MNERNDKQHERYRWVRKRKTNRPIILILTFSIIMIAIAILGSLLLKGSEEHVILNPTDTQPGLTLDDDISSGIEENSKPQSSTDDTEWNLTLVNKWNPIPDNYEINLVEVPGGEKVDERIYEPLNDFLKLRRYLGGTSMLIAISHNLRSKKAFVPIRDFALMSMNTQVI